MPKLLKAWLEHPNAENARKLVAYNNKHMMAAWFKAIRMAYGAGYRAGRAGATQDACPPRLNRILRTAWRMGWNDGTHDRLKLYLQSRF